MLTGLPPQSDDQYSERRGPASRTDSSKHAQLLAKLKVLLAPGRSPKSSIDTLSSRITADEAWMKRQYRRALIRPTARSPPAHSLAKTIEHRTRSRGLPAPSAAGQTVHFPSHRTARLGELDQVPCGAVAVYSAAPCGTGAIPFAADWRVLTRVDSEDKSLINALPVAPPLRPATIIQPIIQPVVQQQQLSPPAYYPRPAAVPPPLPSPLVTLLSNIQGLIDNLQFKLDTEARGVSGSPGPAGPPGPPGIVIDAAACVLLAA